LVFYIACVEKYNYWAGYLKVALLAMGYPPYYQFGGSEVYIRDLSKELTKNGVDVTVIAGWPGKKAVYEQLQEHLRVVRIPVINVPIRPIWLQIQNKPLILQLLKSVDVVHCNNLTTALFNGEIARIKPLIISVHGSLDAVSTVSQALFNKSITPGDLAYLMEYPILRSLYAKDLRESTSLIFISNHGFQEALRFLGEDKSIARVKLVSKSTTIYPGINIKELLSVKPDVNLKQKSSIEVTYVGRLFWPKGITFALDAFNIIVNEMHEKNIFLNILGDGPLKGEIEKLVKRYHLTDNVRIYGQVSRETVVRKISHSKAVIHPSLYEGCPFVLMEANCLGTPVVSFDFDWSREFIIDGLNGFKSRKFDTYDLVRKLFSSFDLDSQKIMEYSQKFDISITTKKTLQSYIDMLEKN
jgi:glycosyltransferase involved in cell wall biosynthesis